MANPRVADSSSVVILPLAIFSVFGTKGLGTAEKVTA